ncbi:Hypothetical predicted protein [Cloeon dipterum]|uniref:RNA-directed DNA polymerase n=1 Tax=Cloeon dipterum TaxID=197152 RepID=A0A8S1DFH4_9INSE|nr:Hypothetical predicted protein [Cloeon dipterum]
MPVTTRKQASNSDTSEFEDAVLTSEQTDEGTQLFVTEKRGESAAEFLADLQRIASKCKFHNVDEQVRSRLISGMRNEKLKESLLAEREEKLTLEYVIQRLMAQERAVAATKALSVSDSDAAAVNKKKTEANFVNADAAEEDEEEDDAEEQENVVINHLLKIQYSQLCRQKPLQLEIPINGKKLTMEVDSGATFSLIGFQTWLDYKKSSSELLPTKVKMRPWGQDREINAAGVVKVQISLKQQTEPKLLDLLVMQQNGPSLIGRNWFEALGITLSLPTIETKLKEKKLKQGDVPNLFKITEIPQEYEEFETVFSPGLGKFKGKPIHVNLKPGAVPKEHAARRVPYSLIGKADIALENLEKCGVIEKVLSSNWAHPVVLVEKGDGVRICADLSLSLNPQAERADFPLPKADDLRTQVKPGYHMSRFDLKDAYLQFELDEESSMMIVINTHRGRFRFRRLPPELEFLGFQFTKAGIRPTDEKVKALQQMRYPENREELQAYLGLLRKGVKFEFTEECKRAVDEAKLVMSKKPCLAFYDESLPVVVACDGSRNGIGAVLSHETKDGEIPVEIEALAVVWAVKKFRQFLWGRKFTLITDHKPLIGIFGEGKGVNEDLPTKLKRYCLFLRDFDYHIVYKPGKQHGNADVLSRLPLPDEDGEEEELEVADCKIAFLECFQHDDIMSLAQLKQETEKDPKMSQLKTLILQGRHPNSLPVGFEDYAKKWKELRVCDGVVCVSGRAAVPGSLRAAALKALHLVHFGMAKMKALARSYFWWPGMDKDIEEMARSCEPCLLVSKSPNKALVIPWSIPHRPWSRIHLDFFELKRGESFVIVAEGLSGYMDVEKTQGLDAKEASRVQHLAQYGVNGKLTFTVNSFLRMIMTDGLAQKFNMTGQSNLNKALFKKTNVCDLAIVFDGKLCSERATFNSRKFCNENCFLASRCSNSARLLDRILNKRIYSCLIKHIPPNQFGFVRDVIYEWTPERDATTVMTVNAEGCIYFEASDGIDAVTLTTAEGSVEYRLAFNKMNVHIGNVSLTIDEGVESEENRAIVYSSVYKCSNDSRGNPPPSSTSSPTSDETGPRDQYFKPKSGVAALSLFVIIIVIVVVLTIGSPRRCQRNETSEEGIEMRAVQPMQESPAQHCESKQAVVPTQPIQEPAPPVVVTPSVTTTNIQISEDDDDGEQLKK